ncbi:MAG TPA: aminotransferase class V-fold PLP-dependent enzyme [Syntrophothermus lipocalidus]|nr:aminotransferase class V-fold PLP-dependent enzyme [Syntrophothermus lipocalidus]
MRQVYVDHSATTPVEPEVFEAMVPYLTDRCGNPSSIYSAGRAARQGMEKAREQVASLLNASPGEIIFTSGGTEADNQAITGYATANRHKGNHIITSAIEHHAVYDTCKYLSRNGFEVTFLPVDGNGVVEPETFKAVLKPTTLLVSIMHANNEVGTLSQERYQGRKLSPRRRAETETPTGNRKYSWYRRIRQGSGTGAGQGG